jgi:hypothetical protein
MRFVVAFILHHCLADGLGGFEFHRSLAKALSHLSTTETKLVVNDPIVPMIPSPEYVHKASSTKNFSTSKGPAPDMSPTQGTTWASGAQQPTLNN